jgi:hypothetical protein
MIFLVPFSSESLFSRLLSKTLKIKIYETIILPLVLCCCETSSFTLMEEHILKVFENNVLRRIGLKKSSYGMLEKSA